jgi:GMP synthase-like glutamine amidotransferase
VSRVLIFRHVPFEGAGLIEGVLRERDIDFDYVDLYRSGTLAPDDSLYDGLIFMGGPMSVNDDLAYLRLEEEILRRGVTQGKPVLGICLGAQLIAKALGGSVRRNPSKEIGWYPLRFTPEAQADPLFSGLSEETVLHWHGETFDLPLGSVLLASSELCQNQAFRFGRCVYALQFHLEVTPAMIADWCSQDANCGDVCDLPNPIDPQSHSSRMHALSGKVFGEWCNFIHSAS